MPIPSRHAGLRVIKTPVGRIIATVTKRKVNHRRMCRHRLLARAVETDAARSFVTFTLDPAARFSDGMPVTPEDVIFSWQILRDKGRPNYRTYYAKVSKAEALGEHAVRFAFADNDDRELPL